MENVNEKLIKEVKAGNIEKVKEFLSKGADANCSEKEWPDLSFSPQISVLMIAMGEPNRNEIVKLLLAKGAKPNVANSSGNTPLHLASIYKDEELIKLLMQSGANAETLNNAGKTPIDLAKSKTLKKLFESKSTDAGTAAKLNTQLILACETSNLNKIKKLVEDGADVNHKNDDGNTALLQVMKPRNLGFGKNEREAMEWLVKNGANINEKNKYGQTPLHLACKLDNLDVVQELLDNQAKITKNEFGETLLHSAVNHTYNSNEKLWQKLLDLKQDVNAKCSRNEDSPLHKAVISHNLKAVTFLIKNKANPALKNKDKETPLDLAKKFNSKKIIEYLESI